MVYIMYVYMAYIMNMVYVMYMVYIIKWNCQIKVEILKPLLYCK